MRARIPSRLASRVAPYTLLSLFALLGDPTAQAAPLPSASVSPSAAPSASASATGAGKPIAISDYAWPTDSSSEPTDAEWATATQFVTTTHMPGPEIIPCSASAVREWMRVDCIQASPSSLLGALWGMAGDLSHVKGGFTLAYEVEPYKSLEPSTINDLTKKMGVEARATLQVRPGSATVLQLDKIAWDDGYDGQNIFVSDGVIIDVSWATGEKYPTVLYR